VGYNQRREGDERESNAHTFRIGSTLEKVIAALLTALFMGTVAGFFEMKASITDMNTNIASLNQNMNTKTAELNANINQSAIKFNHLIKRVDELEADIAAVKADYVQKDMFMETLKRIELYIRNLLLTVGMKEGTLDAGSLKMSVD